MKKNLIFGALLLGSSMVGITACNVGGSSTLSLNTLLLKPKGDSEKFKEFVGNFPKAKFPLKIEQSDLAFFKGRYKDDKQKSSWKTKKVAAKFEEFVPALGESKFSRVPVNNEVHYVAKLSETKDYVALVYAVATSYSDYGYGAEREARSVSFVVGTYNHKGELIDERNVAYLDNYSMSSCVIDKSLKIKTKRTEKVEDSQLAEREIVYQISKSGKIDDLGEKKTKEKEDENRTDYIF
ncbi:MAG: hypothetical protein SFU27_10015 [Thermonemataceae bacterium]|nr:hypothetical protein [Thermonemataceae bacterium]